MKISLTVCKKPLLSKVLLIMKVTTLLMLVFTLQVSAKGFGQKKLNLQFKQTEIASILSTIEKGSHYRFLYDNNLKGIRLKVSLQVKDADLKEVLDNIFANTGLSYQFMDNDLIVIKEAGTPDVDPKQVITGKVTGDNNVPLAGVSVQVKGTSKGTVTNEQGTYTINAGSADVLVFSYVGYESLEVAVGAKSEINAALSLSKKELEQVVVIGYGVANKRDLTGSIVKIAGKEVADKPNTNPVASLQGKVAGLSVVNSGTPGAQPDVRLRGTISIGSVHPVYVVDGILNDNIDFINPNDIESIEVLKDPSSLAIFGVRGAAGVIAITTKTAKVGQTLVNFNSTVGSKKLVDKIKLTNAADFKTLYNEQLANQGSAPFDFTNWTANTDWIDALSQTGLFSTSNISVTGSTDRNKFYMNAGFTHDEGIVKHE
jgi:TonB-dependent SusC/RagA subfamily outer membrane receptor